MHMKDEIVIADLIRAIEAMVLVSQEPVRSELMAQLLERPVVEIESLCERLAESYEQAGHGFELAKIAGGWRFQTHPSMAMYVEQFLLDGQRARLSNPALETLAIVAYKQPISRMQIASIRGVDPDAVLRTLHGRGYVTILSTDPGPGQAAMWGTTQLFLEKLGIASLADMPEISSFVPDANIIEALEKTLRISIDIQEEETLTSETPD